MRHSAICSKSILLFGLQFGTAAVIAAAPIAEEVVVTDSGRYVVPSEKVFAKELGDRHVTVLAFTIGKHTLENVQSALGKATLLPRREQGPNRICYVPSDKHDETVIVFEAGPLGGWKTLTSISILSAKAKFPERSLCTTAASVSAKIGTNSGIKPGMTAHAIKSVLGAPSVEKNGIALYIYHVQKRLTDEEAARLQKEWPDVKRHPFYDVSSFIEATFQDTELISLQVTRTESM